MSLTLYLGMQANGRLPDLGPTVRLAVATMGRTEAVVKSLREIEEAAPTVRLAHVPGAQGDNVLKGQRGVEQLGAPTVRLATCPKSESGANSVEHHEATFSQLQDLPAILVAFPYSKPFLEHQDRYAYRNWALDSGAFTAHQQGKPVDLGEYVELCLKLLGEDSSLAEVFALDVIGDPKASLENARTMWKRGVPAIPAFHMGSKEKFLLELAEEFPKIALGGAARSRDSQKIEWARQCFDRVWPKRVHGFGFSSERAVMSLPWHSVDATSWELGPCKFGQWRTYGKMSVRGSKQNLRVEVEAYLALERRARSRWKREMEELREEAK